MVYQRGQDLMHDRSFLNNNISFPQSSFTEDVYTVLILFTLSLLWLFSTHEEFLIVAVFSFVVSLVQIVHMLDKIFQILFDGHGDGSSHVPPDINNFYPTPKSGSPSSVQPGSIN